MYPVSCDVLTTEHGRGLQLLASDDKIYVLENFDQKFPQVPITVVSDLMRCSELWYHQRSGHTFVYTLENHTPMVVCTEYNMVIKVRVLKNEHEKTSESESETENENESEGDNSCKEQSKLQRADILSISSNLKLVYLNLVFKVDESKSFQHLVKKMEKGNSMLIEKLDALRKEKEIVEKQLEAAQDKIANMKELVSAYRYELKQFQKSKKKRDTREVKKTAPARGQKCSTVTKK